MSVTPLVLTVLSVPFAAIGVAVAPFSAKQFPGSTTSLASRALALGVSPALKGFRITQLPRPSSDGFPRFALYDGSMVPDALCPARDVVEFIISSTRILLAPLSGIVGEWLLRSSSATLSYACLIWSPCLRKSGSAASSSRSSTYTPIDNIEGVEAGVTAFGLWLPPPSEMSLHGVLVYGTRMLEGRTEMGSSFGILIPDCSRSCGDVASRQLSIVRSRSSRADVVPPSTAWAYPPGIDGVVRVCASRSPAASITPLGVLGVPLVGTRTGILDPWREPMGRTSCMENSGSSPSLRLDLRPPSVLCWRAVPAFEVLQ
ncbi:hypothetical protein K488DRAFT_91405 [Vararia minispora EC-137]|uniref:Uncharacterized protein n=1 Tax=Vararia minispora EC-137 TaxID=1314806 RepID=A0ACB8Q6N7_9AGAM|nr:hypothetical protein K488DRAFT_91405 [Vararia minispora EC-137]